VNRLPGVTRAAQLTSSATVSVHVSGDSVKANNAREVLIYDALNLVNRSFEQILQELERLQQFDWFRKQAPIKSVELAVRETRAWTMFEILEVLHEREEAEWTRFGRARSRQEGGRARPRRRPTTK
jgi:hypothetical protein